MKRVFLFLLPIIFLASNLTPVALFAAPNPGVGEAKQATDGYGKYKGAIYWLSWGRENNEQIQEGDKSIFTTPNGVKYEVTISDIQRIGLNGYSPSQSRDYLTAVYPESTHPNWAGGNNLPYAYNFDDLNGVPLQDYTTAIGINANRAEMKFRVTAKAERPNPNYGQPGEPEYIETTSNLIIAGSESLGQDFEYYSLKSPITNEDGEPTKINVLETYMTASAPYSWGQTPPGPFRGEPTDQQWQDRFDLKIDVSDDTIDVSGSPEPARQLKASTALTDNFHGDAMFAALNTNIVDVSLSAAGGQSIAIGVMDLLDGGDAPANYEEAGKEAMHSSIPRLSSESLSAGPHYLVGLEAKNNFTSSDGSTIETPIPHVMRPLLRIGNFIDFEIAPFNSADAQGDDDNGGVIEGSNDDEDGVSTLVAGCRGLVEVANEENESAYLHYWVDKNSNNGFDYTDFTPNLVDQEYGRINIPANYHDGLLPGSTVVNKAKTVEIPVNDLYNPASKQIRLMRFRLSHNQNLKHSEVDLGGEIEDAFVTFLNPRPESDDITMTCGAATTPVKVIDLPPTGWRVIVQKKQANGTYVNQGSPVTGTTEETTLNLAEGEYKIIADSFDSIAPSTCQKETIITIDNDCLPPVAADDTASTKVNEPVVLDITENDTDPDGTIDKSTVTITEQPQHGTITVDATTGKVTYTPDPGYTGEDTFKYTVKDNQGKVSNVATATIKIKSNDPPKITTEDKVIMKGDVLDLMTLVTGATDEEDGDVKSKVKLKDDGGFDPNKPGTYTITFTVTDDDGNTTEETAEVVVKYANVFDPPSARKTVTNTEPEMEWRMVWINDGNAIALNTQVIDPIPANTTYVGNSVTCDARGASTTSVCTYDSAENQIRWEGNIAPDPGGTDEDNSNNEVVIVFKTTVPPEVDSVENQAKGFYDQDADGDFHNDKSGGQAPVLTDNADTSDSFTESTIWRRPLTEDENEPTGNSSIGNYIWHDKDGDGKQDDDEEGLEDIRVKLIWAGPDGKFGTDDDQTWRTETNKKGKYLFEDLPPGKYKVKVKKEDVRKYIQTYDPSGKMNNKATVKLGVNDHHTKADFGYNDTEDKLAKTGSNLIVYITLGLVTSLASFCMASFVTRRD